MTGQHFCGCCGGRIHGGESVWWCARCKPHVRDNTGVMPWDTTYFAQHGKPCPYQV